MHDPSKQNEYKPKSTLFEELKANSQPENFDIDLRLREAYKGLTSKQTHAEQTAKILADNSYFSSDDENKQLVRQRKKTKEKALKKALA